MSMLLVIYEELSALKMTCFPSLYSALQTRNNLEKHVSKQGGTQAGTARHSEALP